ncbi:hypothetical protein CFC21_014303 [Triticum aestivum]|nr:ATG8-interacting protein 1-like [Triticum dicoccoides]XP_037475087.1 ATG8-interacting protein 1-like [Triticum dicoccoides]XP_044454497.1 ATG8-interacting protein 1-like [Triticum aestivum]XP_044454498.1 ATG8-interacting protein 1-like [Triticum aestivum]VAH24107.1 unnamed protein product [Triticum turgidum subsp. durum]KAF6998160.1 hypothetical protein CFC21_014303 [Triticum aestivum]
MSDSEKEVPVQVDQGATRGADWEVVTLTASTYAAAPSGPQGAAEGKRLGDGNDGRGSSSTLLMSDHFVFPPSEHENLPIETALLEPQESTSVEDAGFKNVGGGYDDGSETVKYYDEGKSLSVHDAEMMMGDAAEFHTQDGYVVHDDDDDDSQDKVDAPPLDSGSSSSKGRGGSGAPCQCWLKKHMSCLYDQAKETNHLWGAVVVAALVGLVILWRKDKLHMSCLKWRSRSAVS